MSATDVETIRKGVAALNRGDVDGMAATLDPDVELVPLRAVLDGSIYRGHEGLRRWLDDMSEDWTEFELTLEEVRELCARTRARAGHDAACGAARAGSRSTPRAPGCATCATAKVARIRFFADPESALAAAGGGSSGVPPPPGEGNA